MPLVKIKTEKFPSYWPTPNGTLSIDVSSDEVCEAAAEVGATSAVFGTPSRTWREFLWRVNMILSSLDPTSGVWEQSFSYKRLDPSEKGGVSYYLGMVLPAIIAKKLWNTPHLVHVDAVLKISGQKIGNVQRPDLVGYMQGATANNLGRLLLEAKGRTNGFAQPPVKTAKKQLRKAPPEVLQLVGGTAPRIASLSYFENNHWSGYMVDPPGAPVKSLYSDDEFQTLVDTAYCWPFMEIIKACPGDRSPTPERHTVWMPEVNMKISMPSPIFERLEELSPLAESDSWQELWANISRNPPFASVTAGGEKRDLVQIDAL
ncbi:MULTISPECIES: hypothetical protein [unclassified Corynebacterium]|uniref:hypothetical protein n=1 Tax=unclassified Corynebacterium TaxID=2624378 RepID=UPI0034CF59A0